jgi:hypothetical protein
MVNSNLPFAYKTENAMCEDVKKKLAIQEEGGFVMVNGAGADCGEDEWMKDN